MQSTHLRDGDLHLMGLKKWRIAWSPIGLLPKLETMENNGKQWITIVKSEERIRKDLPSSSYTNDVYVCFRINKVLAYNVVHYIMSYSLKKVIIYSCIKVDSEFFGYQQTVHMYYKPFI